MLADFGDDAKVLAGGQSLVPMLALRLTHFENLIDISHGRRTAKASTCATTPCGSGGHHPRHCRCRRRGGRRGAAADPGHPVRRSLPDPQPRNARRRHRPRRPRGRVPHRGAGARRPDGGRVPAGTRTIPATEFFTGLWETALEPDEVLTAVGFPVWGTRCGFGLQEFARRHGDFAIAGATVARANSTATTRPPLRASACSVWARHRCAPRG